jgi:hypothetical protein
MGGSILFLAQLIFPYQIRMHPPKLTPKRGELASAVIEWPDLQDA